MSTGTGGVALGDFEGYAVVPADRRFVYFPVQDIRHLLREAGELNLLLLFNMVAAGSVPPASDRDYLPLG